MTLYQRTDGCRSVDWALSSQTGKVVGIFSSPHKDQQARAGYWAAEQEEGRFGGNTRRSGGARLILKRASAMTITGAEICKAFEVEKLADLKNLKFRS